MKAGDPKTVQKTSWQQAMSKKELLTEIVLRRLESSLAQVERSRRLVSQSHQIIANIRKSLAHSSRIQYGTVGTPPKNPLIQRRDIPGRKEK